MKNRRILWRKGQNLEVGNLVYHILYGRVWKAIVLQIDVEDEKCLVHMVPGSQHEFHFRKKYIKTNDSDVSGWVSSRWLVLYS